MADVLYKSIDKNMIKQPVAYCKSHHRYLSKKQMKVHRCISRGCTGLQPIDNKFWEERRMRKQLAKQKKNELYGRKVERNGEYGKNK